MSINIKKAKKHKKRKEGSKTKNSGSPKKILVGNPSFLYSVESCYMDHNINFIN